LAESLARSAVYFLLLGAVYKFSYSLVMTAETRMTWTGTPAVVTAVTTDAD